MRYLDQGSNKMLSAIRASKVDLVLLAVAIVWGASYLSAKAITPFATVPAMLSVRFAIATLAMVTIWLIRRKKFSKTDLVLGTIFGLTQSAIMSVETFGLKITSATNAGLLISLTIIFTPIMESAWNKRWLPRSFFLAAVGAIVGVALLVTGNGIQEPNFGDMLLFIAAIVRAVHVTAQGVLTRNREASSFNMILMQCLTLQPWSFLSLIFREPLMRLQPLVRPSGQELCSWRYFVRSLLSSPSSGRSEEPRPPDHHFCWQPSQSGR